MSGVKNKKIIVYDNLKRRIINGSLNQGEALVEVNLANEYKTSKTPIREALQQLEKEGFIEIFHGKGAFVSRITIQDNREIFEIREILECDLIRRVVLMGDYSKEEVEAIKKKLGSAESEGDKNNRILYKCGDKLHAFVFKAFGNKRLIDFFSHLQNHIERLRLFYFNRQEKKERAEESFKEHIEICNALIVRDPQMAEQAMRNHLRNAMAFLKNIA
jgi:DNA-binding GntR family transcriptional regulator